MKYCIKGNALKRIWDSLPKDRKNRIEARIAELEGEINDSVHGHTKEEDQEEKEIKVNLQASR